MNSTKLLVNNFLSTFDHRSNLDLLSHFTLSDTASTKAMTQEVYQKLPRFSISKETQQEIGFVATAFALLTPPVLLLASKAYQCSFTFLHTDPACQGSLNDAITHPAHIMAYLCFASLTILLGASCYSACRFALQDQEQQERFELLDQLYSQAAQTLLDWDKAETAMNAPPPKLLNLPPIVPNKQLSLTQKFWQKILPKKQAVENVAPFIPVLQTPATKNQAALDIANGLAESADLIELSLIQKAHLTPLQAKSLSLKLSYAANKVRENNKNDTESVSKNGCQSNRCPIQPTFAINAV